MTNNLDLVAPSLKQSSPDGLPTRAAWIILALFAVGVGVMVADNRTPAETPRQMADKAEAVCNRVYADNAQLASDCKLRETLRIYAAIYGHKQAEADSSINP